MRHQYNERYDPFRTKAIVRAITVVTTYDAPLTSANDVEKLPIGPKSKDKLNEILTTGRLGRTAVRDQVRRGMVESLIAGIARPWLTFWWHTVVLYFQHAVPHFWVVGFVTCLLVQAAG